jgi:hypothetical protein
MGEESQKRRKNGMRRCVGPGCNSGIRNRGQKQQLRGNGRIEDLCGKLPLHFGNKKATNWIYCKTTEMEILKRAVGIPSGFAKNHKSDLVEGSAPSEKEEEPIRSFGVSGAGMWGHRQMDYGEATGFTDNL